MTKCARVKKSIIRKIQTEIREDFDVKARRFIIDIFKLEKKPIPNFWKLEKEDILKIYINAHRELMQKLMWHRNVPLNAEFLDALYLLDSLPKDVETVLNSMSIEFDDQWQDKKQKK